MKHTNAEMIKAVVDNLELVIFFKEADDARWFNTNIHSLVNACSTTDYFLCLPQHKEACLHWLNGGKAQVKYTKASYPYLCYVDISESNWSDGHVFMDKLLNIRIKPQKEKRWIIWNLDEDRFHCNFKQDPEGRYSANFNFQILTVEVDV